VVGPQPPPELMGEEGTQPMRLAKKFAIAAGSLLALVLAGGATIKF